MTVTKVEAYIEASVRKTEEIEKYNKTDSTLKEGAGKKLLRKIDSINYPVQCTEETVKSARAIQLDTNDIFLISFPNSGIELLKNIILELLDGKVNDEYNFPTIEYFGSAVINIYPPPKYLKTYLNINLCPKLNNCKVIILIRNPKDVVWSMYKCITDKNDISLPSKDFDEFLNAFLKGETEYGDYFIHFQNLIPLIEDKNNLLLTYEQTTSDIVTTITKLAKFLNLHDKVSDQKKLFQIVEEVTLHNEFNYNYTIKEWKKCFDEKQSLKIDEKFETFFKGSILENIFDNKMKW
ncbi:Sulfotransferase 6B1 [Strongyloides ratti]|uniref:Sulfotransferase 6B1 n=1 Tax=Strongyloides ratti TaxID=34506 RepID=A0A090LPG1_STRRB|nr:Sulfotransferase 6B1 [Strongyloides ratti]CEF70084.1 Sulfotransferase 6B1 [Strongyloides ratti]